MNFFPHLLRHGCEVRENRGSKGQRHRAKKGFEDSRVQGFKWAQKEKTERRKTGFRYQGPGIRGQLETGDWQRGEAEGERRRRRKGFRQD